MTTIVIPRVRPAKFDADRLRVISEHFPVDGDIIENDEAIAISGRNRVIVHGQPSNRMAGLTTAFDGERSVIGPDDSPGETLRRKDVLDPQRASEIVKRLIEHAELGTTSTRSELAVDWQISASITEGVHFDGKERTRFPVKTDVRARVAINGLPVSGPRSGASALFTDTEEPLRFHATTWAALEKYDERTLVEKDDAIAELIASRADRHRTKAHIEIAHAKLGYWAGEYCGGADVLEPSWFVEYVQVTEKRAGNEPRKLIRLPAVR